jgi:hypothetical protein
MLAELRKIATERDEEAETSRCLVDRTIAHMPGRAAVRPVEGCLGHVIGGVRGVYDRHELSRKKREAFEALAAQIERILNPADNVVGLRGGKAG